MIGGRSELFLSGPHLQRQRPLRRLRQQLLRIEAMPDLVSEPEPLEPARGEDDRVEAAFAAFAEAGVDVAAKRLDREGRLQCEKLRSAADRRCPNAHARADRGCAAECVARVVALEIGGHAQPLRVARRHVLGRVDGDVDTTIEQRFLQLLDEDAASSDLAERLRPVAVAGRRDRHERDLQARPPQPLRCQLGLSEREPTAARADANQHGRVSAPGPSGRSGAAAGSARTPSAPGGGAVARSGQPSSALVLETEEVTHRVSIEHAIGRGGRLFHPDGWQMQELVEDRRRDRFGRAALRLGQLRPAELGVADLLGARS
jgi:hypothetical protein